MPSSARAAGVLEEVVHHGARAGALDVRHHAHLAGPQRLIVALLVPHQHLGHARRGLHLRQDGPGRRGRLGRGRLSALDDLDDRPPPHLQRARLPLLLHHRGGLGHGAGLGARRRRRAGNGRAAHHRGAHPIGHPGLTIGGGERASRGGLESVGLLDQVRELLLGDGLRVRHGVAQRGEVHGARFGEARLGGGGDEAGPGEGRGVRPGRLGHRGLDVGRSVTLAARQREGRQQQGGEEGTGQGHGGAG